MGISWDNLLEEITCEVDGADGVDMVMDIGRVRPSLSSILPGKLRARPLQAYSQAVPAAHSFQDPP